MNPDVPAPIADAVMKYLRKQPRRRPDSAGLLRSAIAGFLGIDEQDSDLRKSRIPLLRPGLSVTGFVCRASEQEVLDDVLRRCLRPGSAEIARRGPCLADRRQRRAGHRQEQRRPGGRTHRTRPRLPGLRGALLRRQPVAVPAVRRDHPAVHRRAEAPGAPRGGGSRRGPDRHARRRPPCRVAGAPAGDRQRLPRRAAPHRARAPQVSSGRGLPASRFRPRGRLHLPCAVGLLPRDRHAPAGLPELRRPAMGGQELARSAAAPGRGAGRCAALGRWFDDRAPAGDRRPRPAPAMRRSKSC